MAMFFEVRHLYAKMTCDMYFGIPVLSFSESCDSVVVDLIS